MVKNRNPFTQLSVGIKEFVDSEEYQRCLAKVEEADMLQAEDFREIVGWALEALPKLSETNLGRIQHYDPLLKDGKLILVSQATKNIKSILSGLDLIMKSLMVVQMHPLIIIAAQDYFIDSEKGEVEMIDPLADDDPTEPTVQSDDSAESTAQKNGSAELTPQDSEPAEPAK